MHLLGVLIEFDFIVIGSDQGDGGNGTGSWVYGCFSYRPGRCAATCKNDYGVS